MYIVHVWTRWSNVFVFYWAFMTLNYFQLKKLLSYWRSSINVIPTVLMNWTMNGSKLFSGIDFFEDNFVSNNLKIKGSDLHYFVIFQRPLGGWGAIFQARFFLPMRRVKIHNPSRYVILIICSCSNTNTYVPAEEIILNDGPDLFDDPLPGSLKNCQDQEIVINLIMNVADYCCRFGKWLGCSMIGGKNNGYRDRNARVSQWLCFLFVCFCFSGCSMWDLSCFNSPTRYWTHVSCSGSLEP